jgi:hypothetical protein
LGGECWCGEDGKSDDAAHRKHQDMRNFAGVPPTPGHLELLDTHGTTS